ncbi:MAG: hypothetical protein IJU47_00620 [Verrucomicrobia bacterium]|nr:hypothetical protein [Verrucomicrobiota bacterium]
MYKNLHDFIHYLWDKLTGTEFSVEQLLDQLHQDGGSDTDALTAPLIHDLLEGQADLDWETALQACAEVSYYYRAQEIENLTPQQIVAAVFSICVVSDSGQIDEHLTNILVFCGMLARYVEEEWDRILEKEDLKPEDLRENGPKIDEDDLLFLSIYLFSKDDKRIAPPIC